MAAENMPVEPSRKTNPAGIPLLLRSNAHIMEEVYCETGTTVVL